jgi:hypothetical protein
MTAFIRSLHDLGTTILLIEHQMRVVISSDRGLDYEDRRGTAQEIQPRPRPIRRVVRPTSPGRQGRTSATPAAG